MRLHRQRTDPKLLELGHNVTVLDIMWFGNFLTEHENLKILQGDVRNIDDVSISKVDAVIHLANVANDPCGDLNSKLSWEVNALATMKLAEWAIQHHAKQFIYGEFRKRLWRQRGAGGLQRTSPWSPYQITTKQK